MIEIEWEDKWTLGCEAVDNQHKRLIKTLNKIINRETSIQNLLEELIDYTAEHFADEETLMDKANFPEELFKIHRKEHIDFTNNLLDISFKMMEVDSKGLEELIIILEKFSFLWFRAHFLGTDTEFINFLNNGGDKKTTE